MQQYYNRYVKDFAINTRRYISYLNNNFSTFSGLFILNVICYQCIN